MRRQLAAATLAAAALVASLGCDSMVRPEARAVYGPWEEGLTLVYDNPSRQDSQLQVRVKSSQLSGAGRTVVETYSTLAGAMELTFRQERGRVSFKVDGGREIEMLPEGFPDRVSTWEGRGNVYRIVGRSRVDLPGVKLSDPDAIGIWVESEPVSGPPGLQRMRTLLVPDLGEVLTMTWKDGRWLTVNRLAAQGFTDPPVHRSAR
jgi:hypothetical protein